MYIHLEKEKAVTESSKSVRSHDDVPLFHLSNIISKYFSRNDDRYFEELGQHLRIAQSQSLWNGNVTDRAYYKE